MWLMATIKESADYRTFCLHRKSYLTVQSRYMNSQITTNSGRHFVWVENKKEKKIGTFLLYYFTRRKKQATFKILNVKIL